MRKVWILVILILVAMFGGRVWYLNKNKNVETPEIKVGVVLSLTGNNSLIGELSQNALKVAQENINNSKKYPFNIKLVFGDSKSTAKGSIEAYRYLQTQGINLMIVSSDPSALAIGPLAKGKDILILADASGKDVNQSSDMVINFMVPTEVPATKVAEYGVKNLKMHNFAIIAQKEIAAQTMATTFRKGIEQNNAQVITEESFSIDTQNTRDIVLKVLDKKPEAIAVFGWGPGYTNTLNKLKEMGFKGPILTEYSIVSQQSNLTDKGEGIIFADTIFSTNSDDKQVQDFLEKYYQKFGNKQSPDIFAAQVYESLNILAENLEINYKPSEVFEKILSVKDRPSALGTISFKDRFINYPFFMKQFQPDGTAKVVKE